jgi:lipoprotein-releasing system permease protein
MSYELFIALRYLRAKRRQTAVSVITAVATIGITVGVAALIVALALTNGFRSEVRERILQGTAHLNLLKADGGPIENYRELVKLVRAVPSVVTASATAYESVLLSLGERSEQAVIKGVDLDAPPEANEVFANTSEGDPRRLRAGENSTELPGIVVGKELARALGIKLDSEVTVIAAATRLTPLGVIPRPRYLQFRVVGIFSSGLYEYDAKWAYLALPVVQQLAGKGESAGMVQMKVADLYGVEEIGARVLKAAGEGYATTNWQELNRPLFAALQLQQRVTLVFFLLLIVIAALNIITALTMMVIEKHRDIAILRAQGATPSAIGRIFRLQGLTIGVTGVLLGAGLGIGLAWLANAYQLVSVPAEIYSISHITLHVRWLDCLGVCAVTLVISLLATLYPSYSAARLSPLEVLRYE